MKNEFLEKAMDVLDDDLIEEAASFLERAPQPRKRGIRRRWLTLAAAICMALSLCGNVLAVAWVREREEQLAAQEDFYLRYLTESTRNLRQDTFDAEVFFEALDSPSTEVVYVAINRLAECYNDPALRQRAIDAIEPFVDSASNMVAQSAERVLTILNETFDADGICRLADGSVLFTLYPGLDGGDDCTLWRIEDGVLTAWWEMQEPYCYVTDLILSPDREKVAVCLASNKSGFLIVTDFTGGSVSGELVNTALAQYRAEHAQRISVRADFETYSWPENVTWQDEDTLCFDADLYLAPEGDTAAVQAVYHVSIGGFEIK